MLKNKTHNRKKIVTFFFICMFVFLGLSGRLVYLMVFRSNYYSAKAEELHERERSIKAARGRIIDATGTVIADNRTVCTISVIYNQVSDREEVITVLAGELGLSEVFVRKRVEKYSSIERIKSNVDKEIGDRIRDYNLPGVKVDEDYKRYYPYDSLASKVLGFTGGDNQGIIGLEVVYEEYLKGREGTILTMTDAKGVELDAAGEKRVDPVAGNDLYVSLDINIQSYATQLARQVMENKQADAVSIVVMNPQNGELMAMVDVPEFNLNDPYALPEGVNSSALSQEEMQNLLNGIWRNGCINDTYEPGSAFKIITAAAGLEGGATALNDTFNCPGYIMVEDRRIRCHKTTGHGHQTFTEATMNSCNPAFVTIGMKMGVDYFYSYFEQFGLLKKTGVDLPGEAATIMHKKENMKAVELATVAFGQSFQVTPIQLAATASAIVNGGTRVTPHFAVRAVKYGSDALSGTSPNGPDPSESAPNEPDPSESAPSEPDPNESAPNGPVPNESAPSAPTLNESEQSEMLPNEVSQEENPLAEAGKIFTYPTVPNIVSAETSAAMREVLEQVVANGTGRNGYVEGQRIGGKTATSQTLPRGSGRYIASFLGFAPADDPQVLALVIIHNPQGVYYGGQVAAPVVRQLFENILPYLEKIDYNNGN